MKTILLLYFLVTALIAQGQIHKTDSLVIEGYASHQSVGGYENVYSGYPTSSDSGYSTSLDVLVANVKADVAKALKYQKTKWKADCKFATINLLTDYAQECYNDSTQKRTYSDDTNGKRTWKEIIWVHRKATFEAFIEWLKKH